MTDEVKQLIGVMAMLDKCSETPCFKCERLKFNGVTACDDERSVYQHAAELLEAFSSELEQVKAERDGLSIMLTAAQSAAETYKRERDAIGWEYVKDVGMVCPERWNDYAKMLKRYEKRPPKVKED